MHKLKITFFGVALLSISLTAQSDWSSVDLSDELKGKFKISGAAAKSLKENKTFINDFTISQATKMKGSESTATNAVFSEVTLSGVDNKNYQEMVNQMYQHLTSELEGVGLEITNGDEVLKTDYALKQLEKAGDKEVIGNVGTNTQTEGKKKITEGMMPCYPEIAVTTDVSFRPEGKLVYHTSNILKQGNFYYKLASKSEVNLLNIHFYVSFASFDGGRGYKDIKLETDPLLAVAVEVTLVTPKGNSQIYYKKYAKGTGDWAGEVGKVKDNKATAEWLGLARSADYVMEAKPEEYLAELKAIIKAYQRDIAQGIKEEME